MTSSMMMTFNEEIHNFNVNNFCTFHSGLENIQSDV